MNPRERETTRVSIESTKTRVSNFIHQCIEDIEKTVTNSGLTMREIGFDVEKYMTAKDSYIIEMKMRI